MKLIDLLDKLDMLKTKIGELKSILVFEQSEALANSLYELIQEKQRLLVDIQRVNSSSSITIANTKVNVATAIIIRDTMAEKMNIITDLIKNPECKLDKLELQRQRDTIYAEYVVMEWAITANDLNVNINYKEDINYVG